MIQVTPIPCRQDNYAYLVESEHTRIIVDPTEYAPVADILRDVRPTAVLCTHHHHDHVGGNAELVARYPGLPIFASARDRGRVPSQSEFLEGGQRFDCGDIGVTTLHVPGHTTGALAYVIEDCVFTGDTLFMGGCGRLFEGTPEMMHRSLNEILATLPAQTRVYCGHEYTVANLQFARQVEPNNADVEARLRAALVMRASGSHTMGSLLSLERATNPFLRCSVTEVREFVGDSSRATDLEVFAALRRAKDSFTPPAP